MLPSACGALLIATHWCLRRLGMVTLRHGLIRINSFVLAFRRASSRTAWPLIPRSSCLADGDHPVISNSPPVLAAGGAFATRPAICFVASAVHPHPAVSPGTRVAARKDLNRCASLSTDLLSLCKTRKKNGAKLERTSKQMVQSRTSSG